MSRPPAGSATAPPNGGLQPITRTDRRLGDNYVNAPPPKGGGFKLRLKAGSVRRSADSGHIEVVIWLRRLPALYVLDPYVVPTKDGMTALRHLRQVIFAVPNGMAATLVCFHPLSLHGNAAIPAA